MKRSTLKKIAAAMLSGMLIVSQAATVFATDTGQKPADNAQFTLSSQTTTDSQSLVKIARPADGAELSTGDTDLYLTCVNVNADGGFSVSQAALYTPVKVQVLKGKTTISETSIKMSSLNFTDDGVKVGRINLPDAGTYTIRVQAPGSSDVWDSVTVTAKTGGSNSEASGSSYTKKGYLNSTVTASTKNFQDKNFDETKNPGFHLNFKQSEYTIDLNGDNTAKISYYLTVPDGYMQDTEGMKNFHVCDLPEDNTYVKWKDFGYGKSSGEGFTTYTGLKTGTTSVHVYVWADDLFEHHEIKIHVIDSSKTSASDTIKKGSSIKVSGNTYVVTGNNTVTFKKAKSKSIKSISIPASIKYKDSTYKVTAIAAKSFSKYTKLTRVTIGKNIKKIGASAFSGCKNLSKITIKSSALKAGNVGAGAFKGVNAKAVVSVPRAKKAAYKKFLYKKGLGAKVKIK